MASVYYPFAILTKLDCQMKRGESLRCCLLTYGVVKRLAVLIRVA